MDINVIIVTYGSRFNLLKQTIEAVLFDEEVKKIILVDNASFNSAEIDDYIKKDPAQKIILVRNNVNKGSAGGFKDGIIEARKNKSDYVLFLDDDSILEKNWSDLFLKSLNYFPDKNKIILKANRNDNFYVSILPSEKEKVFRVSFYKKFVDFIRKTVQKEKVFCPINYMPHGAFSYSGTFLPYQAIIENDLPFEEFYLYYDDAEYFYRIKNSGYKTYQLYRPSITETDQTFSNDTKFLTSFDKKTSIAKTYFRIRNQFAVALITKQQSKISLFFNGIIVILSKILYAFIKLGINDFTMNRASIILTAYWNGLNLKLNKSDIEKYK
jgi:GT2 family glycosyltransferase